MMIEADRLLRAVGDVRGLAVCDVGVGKGMLLERLAAAGPRSLVGVDLALPYLQRLTGRDDARLVRADAERLPFRSEFDVVVSSDVLEHVLNAGDFLHSVREAIRPGGRFVVRVPHRDTLTSYREPERLPLPVRSPARVRRPQLRRLLREAGFDVTHLRYSGFYASPQTTAVQRRHPAIDRALQTRSMRRYGDAGQVNRIDPR